MGKYNDPNQNPSTVSANVQYNSNGDIILVSGNTYDGLTFGYGSTGWPKQTTIQLTVSGSKKVKDIKTTEIGQHPVDPAIPWTPTNDNGVWSYDIPTKFIGTAKHTVDFEVTWDDGTKHDPEIIINPTNNPNPPNS